MTTWAALAAKQAALATGLNTNIVPTLGARAIDGFAIGALMTAACFIAVTAPRRSRSTWRSRLTWRSRSGWRSRPTWRSRPAWRLRLPGSRALATGWGHAAAARDGRMAAQLADGDRVRPDLLRGADDPAAGGNPAGGGGLGAGGASEGDQPGGYRSRHRRPGPEIWHPEPRRSMPRHAAPPGGIGTKMASLLTARVAIATRR